MSRRAHEQVFLFTSYTYIHIYIYIYFGFISNVDASWGKATLASSQQSLIEVKGADRFPVQTYSMAVWLESGPETSTTLVANLYERRPTSEDSQTRCPSASPEDSTECFDRFDFGDHRKAPKRSETYPFVPPSPSKAHILKPGTASKAYPTTRKRRVMAPIRNSVVPTEFDSGEPPRIRHASTIDTNNSASFDDTAVWDQKAILSLGMYLVQSEFVAPWCAFGLKAGSVYSQPPDMLFGNFLPSLL